MFTDRNKKDPHRGRKQEVRLLRKGKGSLYIEIKKIPIGDGNFGNSKYPLAIAALNIEIKKLPIGDGNFLLLIGVKYE